jgi:hypothetical protein
VTSGWQQRPGEDRWLLAYINLLEGPEAAGRTYVEVPIGGPARYGQGAKTRRVDAVHFPESHPAEVRYYEEAAFTTDIQRGGPVEIIEVKRTLNRPVIGQLIVARELALSDWNLGPDVELSLTAVVTVGDPALEPVCDRLGIQISIVDGR